MNIFIAQYQGIGPLSRSIKFFTRSDWSHSAVVIKHNDISFTLYDAWGFKGVVKVKGDNLFSVLSENHHSGTPVDLFTVDLPEPDIKFLDQQVGKKYDWSLINKFVIRQPASENDKWICSELTGEFCKRSGGVLQNIPAWKMAPEHVGISLRLNRQSTLRTI